MSYEVIIDVSDIEHRSFDFKSMFNESIPCKERIVRCRDCRWFTPEEAWCGNPERCGNRYDSATGKYIPVHIMAQPDGFCSWGERKGEAMSETDKLQRLLDERGVEYEVDERNAITKWVLENSEEAALRPLYENEPSRFDWQAIAATLGWIDEPDTIRNELADGGLIADALAPVCVDEKERRAFERGRVHERFAQQIFKEATS